MSDEHPVKMRPHHLAGLLTTLLLTTSCGAITANRGTVSDASPTATEAAKPTSMETPTWGKRYTWADGLAVEISAPVPCKPGTYAVSSTQPIQRAVQFTITVINGRGEPLDAAMVIFGSDAQFNGRKADEIFDSNGGCGGGFDSATVLPGKSFTTTMAFAVGAEPGEMQLAMRPSLGGDTAVFVGEA